MAKEQVIKAKDKKTSLFVPSPLDENEHSHVLILLPPLLSLPCKVLLIPIKRVLCCTYCLYISLQSLLPLSYETESLLDFYELLLPSFQVLLVFFLLPLF